MGNLAVTKNGPWITVQPGFFYYGFYLQAIHYLAFNPLTWYNLTKSVWQYPERTQILIHFTTQSCNAKIYRIFSIQFAQVSIVQHRVLLHIHSRISPEFQNDVKK